MQLKETASFLYLIFSLIHCLTQQGQLLIFYFFFAQLLPVKFLFSKHVSNNMWICNTCQNIYSSVVIRNDWLTRYCRVTVAEQEQENDNKAKLGLMEYIIRYNIMNNKCTNLTLYNKQPRILAKLSSCDKP